MTDALIKTGDYDMINNITEEQQRQFFELNKEEIINNRNFDFAIVINYGGNDFSNIFYTIIEDRVVKPLNNILHTVDSYIIDRLIQGTIDNKCEELLANLKVWFVTEYINSNLTYKVNTTITDKDLTESFNNAIKSKNYLFDEHSVSIKIGTNNDIDNYIKEVFSVYQSANDVDNINNYWYNGEVIIIRCRKNNVEIELT